MHSNITEELLRFLDDSPVNFLAVRTVEKMLQSNGFKKIEPTESFPEFQSGDQYYTIKNGTALLAFRVGNKRPEESGFKLICAHSDSPCFRIKPRSEMLCEGGIVKLNTEVYGGPILYTWFDRPLSLAGRVLLKTSDILHPQECHIHIRRPLLVIPHLAIHFNRQVNEGNKLSKQKDMLPVLGIVRDEFEKDNLLVKTISQELNCSMSDILDFDLSLFDTTPATLVGLNHEFVSSGRLDDLAMVHAGLRSLLDSHTSDMTQVLAIFDNEETGSVTKQGAASPILRNMLERISLQTSTSKDSFFRSIEKSFMISADMAHAVHPNYPEKHDPTNHPHMQGGPVIKINANQKYVTDAQSSSVFLQICQSAKVPCQYFVNHSDSPGGSTLGNILTSQLPIKGVDMGNPMWAMHSCREIICTLDHEYVCKAFTTFYNL